MFAVEQKREIRTQIRWMIRRDIPEVLAIEEECFEFPWRGNDFAHTLCRHNCIGMVAEYENQIVGFMIYKLHKNRISLLNLAVHPGWQRLGVGSQIIEALLNLEILKQHFHRDSDFITFLPHLKHLVLEVRETNLPAQLFFRNRGFKAFSVLRGYYVETSEDAYLMQYRYKPKSHNKIEKPENLLSRIIGRILG